ncbi:hypothetical protein [Cupriavidus basilensis]
MCKQHQDTREGSRETAETAEHVCIVAMDCFSGLTAICEAIIRLASVKHKPDNLDAIEGLARLGARMADETHNDVDLHRDEFQARWRKLVGEPSHV